MYNEVTGIASSALVGFSRDVQGLILTAYSIQPLRIPPLESTSPRELEHLPTVRTCYRTRHDQSRIT